MSKMLTVICHSHKMFDQEVIEFIQLRPEFACRVVDLAKKRISYRLLLEVAVKLDGWQCNLVDTKYLDHSIKDPEKEFLMLSASAKIKFLHNHQWSIGTPIVVGDHDATRYMNFADVERWLKDENVFAEGILI